MLKATKSAPGQPGKKGAGRDGTLGSERARLLSGGEGRARALALAARHVNASVANPISEEALAAALAAGTAPKGYEHHLFAFFDETDVATMTELVLAGGATYAQLAAFADHVLPQRHRTRQWLDDRRSL